MLLTFAKREFGMKTHKILHNTLRKLVVIGLGGFFAALAAVNVLGFEAVVATISVFVLFFIGYLIKRIRQNIRYISNYRLPRNDEINMQL